MAEAGDQRLVIHADDLDDEPATSSRLVVDFAEDHQIDPDETVAPSDVAQVLEADEPALVDEPEPEPLPPPIVDHEATVEGIAPPPPPPPPVPAPAPAGPTKVLPRLSPAPPALVVDADAPAAAAPAPAPAVPSMLAIESPLFTGTTVVDDLPAVAAFVRHQGRPPLAGLVDDRGGFRSHPLIDLRDLAIAPDGTRIATVSCWSQMVFGLDAVADYVLDADPGLGDLDDGPYGRFVLPSPQLSVGDGAASPDGMRLLTAAPLGVDAPAWSPDGRFVAVLEWRGAQPRVGASWVVLEIEVDTGRDEVIAAVPARLSPGAFARLSYSPTGSHLLLSGATAGMLLDRRTSTWIELPLAAADWSPQRGPGCLIGTDRAVDENGDEQLKIGWFDLETWTADVLGPVRRPTPCVGGLFQLDLSSDGRFLAGVTRIDGDDGASPSLSAHRVAVVDLDDLRLDLVTAAHYDGVPNTVREQRSPRWFPTGGPQVDELTVAPGQETIPGASPRRDELDAELADELEELSGCYHLAATHPGRPGTCAAEAEHFTRRALAVAGDRPWLRARLRDLPAPRSIEVRDVAGSLPPDEALTVATRRAQAACALADGATDEARQEWQAVLHVDPADQEALLHVGPGEPTDEALAAAIAGSDPRLATEARLRRAMSAAMAGLDPTADLTEVAAGPDPWSAARAHAMLAELRLRQGHADDARASLLVALAGPDEAAARAAAALVPGTALDGDVDLTVAIAALGDPAAA